MARPAAFPLVLNGDEPAVTQNPVHGFPVTWNPDNGLFYIAAPGAEASDPPLTMMADWRNVVQWCKRQAGVKAGMR